MCTDTKHGDGCIAGGAVNLLQFGADTWAQHQQTETSQENVLHLEAMLQHLFCFKFNLITSCSKAFQKRKQIVHVSYLTLTTSVAYKY